MAEPIDDVEYGEAIRRPDESPTIFEQNALVGAFILQMYIIFCMLMRNRPLLIAIRVTAVALITIVVLFVVQPISSLIWHWRQPPPGRFYDIGGYRIHMNCRGTGPSTVVFEAGLGTRRCNGLRYKARFRNVQPCAPMIEPA